LGGDKAPTVSVPDKNFQAQVVPPIGGSSFDTGMQNTGGTSFDTGSIHALPGAPRSASSSAPAATAKPVAPRSASSSAPAAKPKPKPTEIPPDINSPEAVLDYLSIPDETEMNKRLVKIGAWLNWRGGKHEDHTNTDLKTLNKFLMSSQASGGSTPEIEDENKKYGESYKKHLIQKLTNKPVEPDKTEPSAAGPSTASTEPAVSSTTTNPVPGATPAVKKKDPHGLINKSMRQMKKLLKDLHFLRDGKPYLTDEEIGEPDSKVRKDFIIRYKLEDEIKQKAISDKELSQTESFTDKVKFYKEALRGL
jgi:hypothetical protein